MNLADVNVLIHAVRTDSADHERCKKWLFRETGEGPFAVASIVLSSVVRLVTNRRIFPKPNTPRDALAFCSAILNAPNATRLEPGVRHWNIFERLVEETTATANLIPDAWLAALAIEHGCTLVTLDRGSSRFPGLAVAAP